MNSQVTVFDRNGQPMNVELICYFSSGSKKYAFYTKNELVQDGLIKMYVAEENTGLSSDITPDEWNDLKKVMQGIITGGATNIQFLAFNNSLKLNDGKAIALNDANINAIKNAHKNSVGMITNDNSMSNKDLLSQSFGGNVETSVSTPEPVQISAIPQSQNSFNMEATPVSLNTNPVEPVSVNPFDAVPNIEPIESTPVMDTPSLNTNINASVASEPALNINSIKPSGIESGFKVSNEPNIFDQPVNMPFSITEEEVNKPLNDVVSPISETVGSSVNVFNQPVGNIGIPLDSSVSNDNMSNKSNGIDVDKKIALNERKIKLFEELANIYKEENELLKSDNSSLENTASNLFNNNGTLNESEVLR